MIKWFPKTEIEFQKDQIFLILMSHLFYHFNIFFEYRELNIIDKQ
jgi:hypothetical protein